MLTSSFSGDVINVALRQMGATSIKEVRNGILYIAKFELSNDLCVTYVFDVTKRHIPSRMATSMGRRKWWILSARISRSSAMHRNRITSRSFWIPQMRWWCCLMRLSCCSSSAMCQRRIWTAFMPACRHVLKRSGRSMTMPPRWSSKSNRTGQTAFHAVCFFMAFLNREGSIMAYKPGRIAGCCISNGNR